ncbi:Wzz/FepE/Etk N-terminal domain-containing protein [Hoeflea ulvae]|uniref:Wzz/FepE/Etk N-terminal domain-containing protein n=1 Tax=Hoeflea ulvae TaxID=2983764 RepID=A0ABT3YB45_9HYPH|nr:Wzz/FepE/Etk N-terminal domain-containing protein [Hoeflea ulvae]MCY0093027.1 Wzz/FepE/Etk N-terminal domain-containing protein [Hoeflea ulvae]
MYVGKDSEELSIIDVVLALWRGKFVILGITVIALIAGAGFASLQKDSYQVSVAIHSDFGGSLDGGVLLAELGPGWALGANWLPVPKKVRTVVAPVSEGADISPYVTEVSQAVNRVAERQEKLTEIQKDVLTERLPYAMRDSDSLAVTLFNLEVYSARVEAGQVFGKALGPEESDMTGISTIPARTDRIFLLAAVVGFGLGCFIVLAGHAVTNYRRWKKASQPA